MNELLELRLATVRPSNAAPRCQADESKLLRRKLRGAPRNRGMLRSMASTIRKAAMACRKRVLPIGRRKKQYRVELLANTPSVDKEPLPRRRPTVKAARNIKTDQRKVRLQFTRISILSSNTVN